MKQKLKSIGQAITVFNILFIMPMLASYEGEKMGLWLVGCMLFLGVTAYVGCVSGCMYDKEKDGK